MHLSPVKSDAINDVAIQAQQSSPQSRICSALQYGFKDTILFQWPCVEDVASVNAYQIKTKLILFYYCFFICLRTRNCDLLVVRSLVILRYLNAKKQLQLLCNLKVFQCQIWLQLFCKLEVFKCQMQNQLFCIYIVYRH